MSDYEIDEQADAMEVNPGNEEEDGDEEFITPQKVVSLLVEL